MPLTSVRDVPCHDDDDDDGDKEQKAIVFTTACTGAWH
jgi:hypothetical protein